MCKLFVRLMVMLLTITTVLFAQNVVNTPVARAYGNFSNYFETADYALRFVINHPDIKRMLNISTGDVNKTSYVSEDKKERLLQDLLVTVKNQGKSEELSKQLEAIDTLLAQSFSILPNELDKSKKLKEETLKKLQGILIKISREEDARTVLEKVIVWYDTALNVDVVNRFVIYKHRALAYQTLKQYNEAIANYSDYIKTFKEVAEDKKSIELKQIKDGIGQINKEREKINEENKNEKLTAISSDDSFIQRLNRKLYKIHNREMKDSDDNYSSSYLERGRIYYKLGDFNQAERDFFEAKEWDDKNFEAHFYNALYFTFNNRNLKKAESHINSAVGYYEENKIEDTLKEIEKDYSKFKTLTIDERQRLAQSLEKKENLSDSDLNTIINSFNESNLDKSIQSYQIDNINKLLKNRIDRETGTPLEIKMDALQEKILEYNANGKKVEDIDKVTKAVKEYLNEEKTYTKDKKAMSSVTKVAKEYAKKYGNNPVPEVAEPKADNPEAAGTEVNNQEGGNVALISNLNRTQRNPEDEAEYIEKRNQKIEEIEGAIRNYKLYRNPIEGFVWTMDRMEKAIDEEDQTMLDRAITSYLIRLQNTQDGDIKQKLEDTTVAVRAYKFINDSKQKYTEDELNYSKNKLKNAIDDFQVKNYGKKDTYNSINQELKNAIENYQRMRIFQTIIGVYSSYKNNDIYFISRLELLDEALDSYLKSKNKEEQRTLEERKVQIAIREYEKSTDRDKLKLNVIQAIENYVPNTYKYEDDTPVFLNLDDIKQYGVKEQLLKRVLSSLDDLYIGINKYRKSNALFALNKLNDEEKGELEKQLQEQKKGNGTYYYTLRGYINKELGKDQIAIEDFTEAINLQDNRSDSDKSNINYNDLCYKYRGDLYLKGKNYKEAVEDYDKVIERNLSADKEKNPYLAVIYHDRGLCYKNLGDKAKANRDFSKATELGYEKEPNIWDKITKGVTKFKEYRKKALDVFSLFAI